MLKDRYPLYVANQPLFTSAEVPVVDKYSGFTATRVSLADRAIIEQAIAAASSAVRPMRELAPHRRKAVLVLGRECDSADANGNAASGLWQMMSSTA